MKVAKIEPHQVTEQPELEPFDFQPAKLPEVNSSNSSKQPEENTDLTLSQNRLAELISMIDKAKQKHHHASDRRKKRAIDAYKAHEKFEDERILSSRYKFTA